MRSTLRFLALASLVGLTATWSEPAEAKFVFPYNHPDLDWYSIETEHFVVHYPKSKKEEGNDHFLDTEWTAKKSAKIAEEMYPRMCAEFNYYIKEKVHIVLLNQSDDLEGFTIPNWDWIEISANPGGDFYRQRGRMDWLPDVLVHEYAHVVSLKANATFAEGTQAVSIGGLYSDGLGNTESGAEINILDGDPFYWTEGGAEYWSDNAGYNWWTPSRDMHIRTTVLEDRLLSYDEWQTRVQTLRWGDGERGYQQGYSFALYLRQRFGPDTYNQFALENSKGWKPDWSVVIEKVTGVPGETLYNDWVVYVKDRYGKQYDKVKAEGEVAGLELLTAAKDWQYTDPDGRDKWFSPRWKRKTGVTGGELARMEREKAKEGTGTWQMVPRYSDDGEWLGVNSRGSIKLTRAPEETWAAFSGEPSSDAGIIAERDLQSGSVPGVGFMHAWDFVPGRDAVVFTGNEHFKPADFTVATGIRLETDGYDWKQLWIADFANEQVSDKNLKHKGFKFSKASGKKLMTPETKKAWQPIPNTFRGSEPAVSPDGKKVAYLEYADGTLNLVTINLDGSEKKALTTFADGTWMQRADWSPDGSQLVVAIFRNFQQDLYVMDADGTNIHPIMFDRWEDQDPNWAKDGKIYFSSDPSGIFNVYAYDPKTEKIEQVTNVIGGAEAPALTPQGNLVYSAYTAHGWKTYGLAGSDFFHKDATAQFDLDYEPAAVKAGWEFREDLSAYVPKKYDGDLMAPTGAPIIRVTNDGRDNLALQVGGQIFMQDFVENHGAFVQALVGEDLMVMGQYFYQGWYPTFYLTAYHYEVKINYGFLLDDDNNVDTTQDQSTLEGKNQQYGNILMLQADYPWNDRFSTMLFSRYQEYGFRTTTEANFAPYQFGIESGISANFTNIGFFGNSANPTGGRNVDLTYTFGYTDVVYQAQGGHSVDDGELLDKYPFNKVELRWTEQIPVPGWLPFMQKAQDYRHTIQVDFQAGVIDRNVDRNDEFRGGGQHPFNWGSGSLRPNTLFAGYPSNSLSGETMALVNVAYRFPIRRELNKRLGPFYFYDVTGQVMGTAGNFWSYQPPEDEADFYRNEYGERVARDASTVTREVPFLGLANKNGNAMLFDAGAELRVSASIFSGASWDSFVRVVYGFNEIRGYGDVNGDDIQDSTDSAIGDELSNETEKPGVRVYVGLGTGW
ncbi:MAG: hypothetical protein Q8P18_34000 [Pseudomonadota bacterium]|nr:hypothetical protein [Pseudomonadota bacterium]